MNPLEYRDWSLTLEDVNLADVAKAVGTPCYVYSRAEIEGRFRSFDAAFAGRDHLVCYAVKANSNLAVLNVLARLGAGFDIVSGGELARVIAAGGDASRVVFSGVGKTADEMRAALDAGIFCFNVESESELEVLGEVAAATNRRARIALRVNPDVDPATHPYISTGLKESKFGIAIDRAFAVYERARQLPGIEIAGVACHIGSQLTELSPFLDAVDRVVALADALEKSGITLRHLDLGGGLGIRYGSERPPAPTDYVNALLGHLGTHGSRYAGIKILIEPGRAIVGNAGVLLTRVQYLKLGDAKHFAVVDAAMNDLIRPALYDAWHEILAVEQRADLTERVYDVVGPVCESGDFLGQDRRLGVAPGDLLAVASAGAYGAAMSSNYNTRPRAAEVMVDGARYQVVRRRETVAELFAGESVLT